MVDLRSDAVDLADARPAPVAAPLDAPVDAPVDTAADAPAPAGRCPIDHRALAAATCPFPMGAASGRTAQRSNADLLARRVLRIRERPPGVSANAAYATFQRSMLISATRCLLTYIVFPFVLPAAGFATGVGPILGIIIGTLAITCDVFTVRRLFQVDHRWRWHFSAVAVSVIGLLSVLLVQDIVHLAS